MNDKHGSAKPRMERLTVPDRSNHHNNNHNNNNNSSSNKKSTTTTSKPAGPTSSARRTAATAKTAQRKRPAVGVPPDGGFGWVVVLSSFSISLLVDGVCFSFGVFFDAFRYEFQTTKATTSWIGSVLNGSYLIIGPFVSALVNVYGCRRVTLVGAVLASIAFFVSSFSTNIGLLIFTYGFLGGVGFGLMYLPAIVMVGYYFDRRRALATGIACCGSGIGAFLFAPLTEFLLEEYGWRGGTWILSALVFHGVLFALFYRPLPVPDSEEEEEEGGEEEEEGESQPLCQHDGGEGVIDLSPVLVEEGAVREPSMQAAKEIEDSWSEAPLPSTSAFRTRSMTMHSTDTPSCDHNDVTDPPKTAVVRLAYSQDFALLHHHPPHHHEARVRSRGGSAHSSRTLTPLQRKDIFYSGSLLQLKEYKELGSVEEFRREMTALTSDVTEDEPASQKDNRWSQAFHAIFDVTLLHSPTFLIYGASCFLCMAGFFVPFTYMPTYAMDMGSDSWSAAFLISVIGITNIVGRVAVGFVSDLPCADCLLINNVALIIGGVATLFVPFYSQYYILAIYCAVFGTSIAVFVSLRSIIMVELMGLEKLTTTFGFVIMCQGSSSMIGAPIAGALSDATGSDDWAFYLAGMTLTLSGIICLPLRRVARWEGLVGPRSVSEVITTDGGNKRKRGSRRGKEEEREEEEEVMMSSRGRESGAMV